MILEAQYWLRQENYDKARALVEAALKEDQNNAEAGFCSDWIGICRVTQRQPWTTTARPWRRRPHPRNTAATWRVDCWSWVIP